MASDDFNSNSDKTVFRQPTGGSDHTVLKPMPGGRRHNSSSARPIPRAQTQQSQSYDFGSYAINSDNSKGLNPLVKSASVLIAVFVKTRNAVSHPDVAGLHQQLTSEIKSFEAHAKEQGLRSEIVLSARYILCTILDEAVLNTPWGSRSSWHQRSLLSAFHNETSGGEKFYLILDKLRESPSNNLDILELIYICLSVGFEGKYGLANRGKEKIDQKRDELYSIIRKYRGDHERELSPNWQGLGKTRNTLTTYVPLWVVASFVGVVLFVSYSGFRYWLYSSSVPVVAKLEAISNNNSASKRIRFGN
ncbi:MAG: type IVB secretion system protein IcmH/DotU [Thiohalomonadales bacterium]